MYRKWGRKFISACTELLKEPCNIMLIYFIWERKYLSIKKNPTGFSCNFKYHISEPQTRSCFLNILWLWTRMGKQPTSASWTPCGARYSPTRTVEVLNLRVRTSRWCVDKGTSWQWLSSYSPGCARRWGCSSRSPVMSVYFIHGMSLS